LELCGTQTVYRSYGDISMAAWKCNMCWWLHGQASGQCHEMLSVQAGCSLRKIGVGFDSELFPLLSCRFAFWFEPI
jgi:hypothetical protein